jgi:hypothetical protein
MGRLGSPDEAASLMGINTTPRTRRLRQRGEQIPQRPGCQTCRSIARSHLGSSGAAMHWPWNALTNNPPFAPGAAIKGNMYTVTLLSATGTTEFIQELLYVSSSHGICYGPIRFRSEQDRSALVRPRLAPSGIPGVQGNSMR